MIYKDYIRHKADLVQALKDYSDALDEKAELFQRTQPSSMSFDRIGSAGTRGNGTDQIDEYLIQTQRRQLDERIRDARDIVELMMERLENDETMLKMSDDAADHVFLLRYVKNRSAADTASILHYSQSYVFKLCREIEKSIAV